MIIINGKYFRNLQEQVLYLTELIEALKSYIDESKILTLPAVAPPKEAIVTVGPDNQQSQLFLGKGLSISENTIVTDVQMFLIGTTLNITSR